MSNNLYISNQEFFEQAVQGAASISPLQAEGLFTALVCGILISAYTLISSGSDVAPITVDMIISHSDYTKLLQDFLITKFFMYPSIQQGLEALKVLAPLGDLSLVVASYQLGTIGITCPFLDVLLLSQDTVWSEILANLLSKFSHSPGCGLNTKLLTLASDLPQFSASSGKYCRITNMILEGFKHQSV